VHWEAFWHSRLGTDVTLKVTVRRNVKGDLRGTVTVNQFRGAVSRHRRPTTLVSVLSAASSCGRATLS
jgi:hypothetical protein